MSRLAPRQVDSGLARGHPMLLSAVPTEDTIGAWPDVPLRTYADLASKITYRILGASSSSWAVPPGPLVHLADTALAAETTYLGTQARLILAAESGDEADFIQVAATIDWSQCAPTDFGRGVRLALTAGAYLLARNLAAEAATLHPNDQELRQMARVLAPPRVTHADMPATASVRPNQAWLRDNGSEYEGQWVALRQGTLLAAGRSAREVWDRLESTEGVMLTKVF